MPRLKPWIVGPYELLRNAELHRERGSDFDRRMAVINCDNAIELSITTYLDLDPKQRSGRSFPRESVNQWRGSYHAKLDFLEHYVVKLLGQPMAYERDEIIYYHKIRNDLYHAHGTLIPRAEDVSSICEIAQWVFGALYGVDPQELLTAEAGGLPVEVPSTDEPPPESQVFAALLELKKDIAQLRHESRGRATDDQVVDDVLRSEATSESVRFKDALRRANQLASDLREERPVVVSRAELDELIPRLQQLKQRVEVPLRAYQERLAHQALEATLNSIEAKRQFIGYVSQPAGSGLATTLTAYVARAIEQPAFREFLFVVVADFAMVVEQIYARISALDLSRQVLKGTRQTFGADFRSRPPGIVVTTIQGLRASGHALLPEKTIIVTFGLDMAERGVMTQFLSEHHVIAFTNTVPARAEAQRQLIGQYSMHQAMRDGILTRVAVEHRGSIFLRAQGKGESGPMPLEEDEGNVEFDELSQWTEERVNILAEDILNHFSTRSSGQQGRAVVIVSRIEHARRLRDALRSKLSDGTTATNRDVAALTSDLSQAEVNEVLTGFAEETEPRILICGRSRKHIDLSRAQYGYLTCKLTPSELGTLVGQLSSLRPGKTEAVIVDYAGNWPDVFRTALGDEI
jgi:hypothetical protein